MLVYLYENGPLGARDERASPENDDALLALYQRAVDIHTDGWVLYGVHGLPRWWRLVREIRAENLSDGSRDRVTWPMSEAAMRVSGLTLVETPYDADGWRRVRRGPRAGSAVKVKETRNTARLVEGVPDRSIHHPEAFPDRYEDVDLGGDPATAAILIPAPVHVTE